MKVVSLRIAGFGCLVWCFAAGATAAEDRLTLLDGDTVAARITSIDGQGQVQAGDLKAPLNLGALRQIDRPATPQASQPVAAPALRLFLNGGGSLAVSQVVIGDDACHATWAYGKDLSLPLDSVRGVLFQAEKDAQSRPKGSEQFDKQLAKANPEHDQLFLLVDGGVQAIDGLFEELTSEGVVFNWRDKKQTFARAKLYGLAIAPLDKPADRSGQCLVALADGSSLLAQLLKLDAGKLQLAPSKGKTVELPWDAVVRINIRNDRLTFLSDLQPVAEIQETLLTPAQPWQRDKSVSGHPLTLGDRSFSKGLGVHSRCLLTFANDGFDLFAATIGIDAETHGRGDCLFVVEGDGKELFKQRMRAADAPVAVRLPIVGVRRITLGVEPGEGLDLADHGDWADARLIRAVKSSSLPPPRGEGRGEGPKPSSAPAAAKP